MTVQPRLLFVDDDAMIGRLFERLVSRLGYAVDIASGFPDAVRRSALYEYDVIATALTMGGVSGVELVEQLAPKAAATVFLLVTGAVELQPFRSKLVDQRVVGVISKPFDPTQLQRALEGAFAISARRREGRVQPEPGSRTAGRAGFRDG